MMRYPIAILLLIASLPTAIAAQDSDDNQPTVHKIVARAAGEPVPALRYQLLPPLLEQKPGNAALLYLRVVRTEVLPARKEELQDLGKVSNWLDAPLEKLPRDEVRQTLDRYAYRLDQVALAARRNRCDWEYPLRDGRPWELLLPEVQGMREFGRMLAVRARLAIAEQRYDDAIRDLQTGFALGRHVGEGPTLVSGLVGIAICDMMLDQVEALVQAPGAPNVYWALMALPRPMIDLRPALDFEMHWVAFGFPQLYDAETSGRTAEQWQKLIAEMQETARGFVARKADWEHQASEAVAGVKAYPEAKRYLVAQGRSPTDVEAMPVGQVLAIYAREKFHRLRDDRHKWRFVPYAQRGEGPARAGEAVRRAVKEPQIFPFETLLSAVDLATLASLRTDRRIAALSVLEGLRMFAAENGGKLPRSLADMTNSPALADPITGESFIYRVDGNTATLEGPAPRGRPSKEEAMHYELTIGP